MRQFFLLFGLLCMISVSCDKDSDSEFDKDSDSELKDKIVYLDLSPDLVLHPVDSVGLHPSGFCSEVIPFPTDSTVLIDLDINQDGQDDFRFTYSTFFEWVSVSSPCANYNSTLQVGGLTTESKISVANADMREIRILENGDLINSDQLFASNATLYRDNAMGFSSFSGFSGEGFIGVKLSSGELAWIKLNFQKDSFTCTILEYGYNENINSPITAGQIE